MAPSTSASSDHSAGLCAGRQRHMVRLSARHRSHAAGRLLRQPVCAPLRLAGLALHLHRQHACRPSLASSRHGHCCLPISPPAHRLPAERSTTQACFPSSSSTGRRLPIPMLVVVCAVAGFIAYRDVKLSAEVMLWIEAVSVSFIVDRARCCCRSASAFNSTPDQFRLKGASFSALGPALVLSMFSFVGFESATTLGGEAREPLKTIPRAVLQCALLAGVFFMLCSYSEVLGFRGQSGALSAIPPARCTCSPPKLAFLRWAWPSTSARSSACLPACWPAPPRPRAC